MSLESLRSADRIGRWWIVGSSWSGAPMIGSTSNGMQQILPKGKVNVMSIDSSRGLFLHCAGSNVTPDIILTVGIFTNESEVGSIY